MRQRKPKGSCKEKRQYFHKVKLKAEHMNTFLQATGISMAYKVVFAELIAQNMNTPEVAIPYMATRLREIGHELQRITIKAKSKTVNDLNKSFDRIQNPEMSASKLKSPEVKDKKKLPPIPEKSSPKKK